MYASRSNGDETMLLRILEQSRHNNAIDGVTGMLWGDGDRFLQVLEGSDAVVTETFRRIRRDPRHHAIEIVLNRVTSEREFGDWSMALRRPDETATTFDERVRGLFDRASDAVREGYLDLVAAA